jgi:hypothetical protein
MLKRLATSTAVIAALALPVGAYAQGATAFYIIQDAKTKKCSVVDKKPVATEATIVGPDGVVYKTKTEAETAMKTVKVCSTT